MTLIGGIQPGNDHSAGSARNTGRLIGLSGERLRERGSLILLLLLLEWLLLLKLLLLLLDLL